MMGLALVVLPDWIVTPERPAALAAIRNANSEITVITARVRTARGVIPSRRPRKRFFHSRSYQRNPSLRALRRLLDASLAVSRTDPSLVRRLVRDCSHPVSASVRAL